MKTLFKLLAKGLAKAAVWCAEHPDEIIAIADAAKKAKAKK